MLTANTLLETAHVLAAIAWVGGGTTMLLLGRRLLGSRDGAQLLRYAGDLEWLASFLFIPASMSTLVLGVVTALVGHDNLLTPWLLLGIAGIAATTLTGILYFKPAITRVLVVGRLEGVNDPEIARRLRQIVAVNLTRSRRRCQQAEQDRQQCRFAGSVGP